MEKKLEKINELLEPYGLNAVLKGVSGGKLIFIKSVTENFLFNLTLSWHGEVIIDQFEGQIDVKNSAKYLRK
ncbi:MAG: hypothetical protein BGO29_14605 [Bacteroidales bacterium 36-12]|nr:MAG: hypothetical protein BGO29_14605 [Bacteroidales bacterium 36-12]